MGKTITTGMISPTITIPLETHRVTIGSLSKKSAALTTVGLNELLK